MALSLRKEQVLFGLVLLFVVWQGYNLANDKSKWRAGRKKAQSYEEVLATEPFLAGVAPRAASRRDLFREPTETKPLPPKNLPFPALDPLPVVYLPLPLGPEASAYGMLRGTAKVKVAGGVKDAAGNGDKDPDPQDPPTETVTDHSLRYDSLVMVAGGQRFWGYFTGVKAMKYSLGMRKGPYPADIKITFDQVRAKTGELAMKLGPFTGDLVAELQLAKTLENEVEIRRRRFAWAEGTVHKQQAYVRWLLTKARGEPRYYKNAIDAAELHLKFAGESRDAYLLLVSVLRAQADLEGEFALYGKLPKKHEDAPFRHRGLGELQALIGLDIDAERSLRKALDKDPTGARNLHAMARFLLDRDRGVEALPYAKKAKNHVADLDLDAERLQVDITLVEANLAVGDMDAARSALPAGGDPELAPRRAYVEACVAYAGGDIPSAQEKFQEAYSSGVPAALLGLGACQLRAGDVSAATSSFSAVAEQNPALLHLAHAGLGLCQELQQSPSGAVTELEKALEAAPSHPYLLYLMGREKRLAGDLEGAADVLAKCLQERDDLVEAMAELSRTYFQMFSADRVAQNIANAVTYMDRVAMVDAVDRPMHDVFVETQGVYRFHAGDLRGAQKTFESLGSDNYLALIGSAITYYKMRREDRAREIIEQIQQARALNDKWRNFAKMLQDQMDAHANLEQVEDRFERRSIGRKWTVEQSGVRPRLLDGVLKVEGEYQPRANARVAATRTLDGTGRIVSVAADMKVGSASRHSFVGLLLTTRRAGKAGGQREFNLEFGVNEKGQVHLRILDGRSKPEEQEPIVKNMELQEWNNFELRFEPEKEKGSQNLVVVALCNGELVARRRVKLIRRTNKSGKLRTELQVRAGPRRKVDVAFDNYRRVQIRK